MRGDLLGAGNAVRCAAWLVHHWKSMGIKNTQFHPGFDFPPVLQYGGKGARPPASLTTGQGRFIAKCAIRAIHNRQLDKLQKSLNRDYQAVLPRPPALKRPWHGGHFLCAPAALRAGGAPESARQPGGNLPYLVATKPYYLKGNPVCMALNVRAAATHP